MVLSHLVCKCIIMIDNNIRVVQLNLLRNMNSVDFFLIPVFFMDLKICLEAACGQNSFDK